MSDRGEETRRERVEDKLRKKCEYTHTVAVNINFTFRIRTIVLRNSLYKKNGKIACSICLQWFSGNKIFMYLRK